MTPKTTLLPLLLFLFPILSLAAPTPTSVLLARDATTENGLTTDACKPLTLIFARGTNEAGNVGSVAGPPLFTALRSTLGESKITVQGVPYDASFAGYFEGGDPAGSSEMLALIQQAAKKCPQTKLVLGGYSQGAQLVHNAAKVLSAAISAQVVAVIVFGDPDNGQAIGLIPSMEVDSICHDQDIICTGSGGFATHLTYGDDAAAAAGFVVTASGL